MTASSIPHARFAAAATLFLLVGCLLPSAAQEKKPASTAPKAAPVPKTTPAAKPAPGAKPAQPPPKAADVVAAAKAKAAAEAAAKAAEPSKDTPEGTVFHFMDAMIQGNRSAAAKMVGESVWLPAGDLMLRELRETVSPKERESGKLITAESYLNHFQDAFQEVAKEARDAAKAELREAKIAAQPQKAGQFKTTVKSQGADAQIVFDTQDGDSVASVASGNQQGQIGYFHLRKDPEGHWRIVGQFASDG
jgi:hypothetical protein